MHNFLHLTLLALLLLSCNDEPQKAQEKKSIMQQYELVTDVVTSKKGVVKKGEGLFQVLGRVGIDDKTALKIINALSDEVEFSTLKVGDSVTALFNSKGKIVEFFFSQNSVDTHKLKINNNNLIYSFNQKETKWESRIIEGEIEKKIQLFKMLSYR